MPQMTDIAIVNPAATQTINLTPEKNTAGVAVFEESPIDVSDPEFRRRLSFSVVRANQTSKYHKVRARLTQPAIDPTTGLVTGLSSVDITFQFHKYDDAATRGNLIQGATALLATPATLTPITDVTSFV